MPYKSTAEVIGSLRTGDTQVALDIVPPLLGQFASKQLRPLAIASNQRFPGLPDVPTVAESGVPGYEAPFWIGITVPALTPDATVRQLHKAIERAIASPEIQKSLQEKGYTVRASTPEQMAQRIQQETVKWKAVTEKAGVPKL